MKPEYTCKWVAGLSNGETAIEGVGRFEEVTGEISPWQKLDRYLSENQLVINSLKIRVYSNLKDIPARDFNLPSNKPRFDSKIPLDFNYGRRVAMDVGKIEKLQPDEKYIFIQAIYEDHTMSLYVDEYNPSQSWVTLTSNFN